MTNQKGPQDPLALYLGLASRGARDRPGAQVTVMKTRKNDNLCHLEEIHAKSPRNTYICLNM